MRAPKHHPGEPGQPDRGRAGRDPRQRAQPALRGFPWISCRRWLSTPSRTRTTATATFDELEAASPSTTATSFFDPLLRTRQRGPRGHAATWTADDAMALVERHFGDVAEAQDPQASDASFAEPLTDHERRGEDQSTRSPRSRRSPSGSARPTRRPTSTAYLAAVVLAEVLAEGDASRLQQRLVLRDRLATSVEAYLGTFGDPFEQRDPLLFTFEAHHPPQGTRISFSTRSMKSSTGSPPTAVARRARPGPRPAVGAAVPRGRRRARPHPEPGRVRAAPRRARPWSTRSRRSSPTSPRRQIWPPRPPASGRSRAACSSSNPVPTALPNPSPTKPEVPHDQPPEGRHPEGRRPRA